MPSLKRIETKSVRIRYYLNQDDTFQPFGTFLPHSRISCAHWLHGCISFCKHMSCIGCLIETKAQFCFNSGNASDNSAISAGPIARSHPTRFLSFVQAYECGLSGVAGATQVAKNAEQQCGCNFEVCIRFEEALIPPIQMRKPSKCTCDYLCISA